MDIQGLIEADRMLLGFFNGSDSLFLDGLMVTFTSGLTWLPLYLSLFYLVVKNNETMGQICLIIGCALLCVVLADGMADGIMKPLVARSRPSNDPIIKYTIDIVDNMRETGYSFFSAHAANTFSLALFFSLLVKDRIFTVFMIGWSVLNCYTRLYLGVHYPSDILVGLLWGTICGTLSYILFRYVYNRISPKNNYVSSQYTVTGYALTDINIVITVVCLILIYAVLRALFVFYI
ncbi:PAP2 family protein [Hoylesella oralis ATCC 33269]|uniref:PAP2 family protein n=1 Tax=Hoylesella oralis ATCC 33269 TaxID=873533 RepID=E7RS20_9BACT|nr:phosphatase PAP2 family protein [Hoylesella oralis]EFZ36021.1 PAP2 family protein [Hoylesella oralis ATCC 33269]EPH19144.1 hypothetical protein HMPREF1475_00392 [Hoylesella oralis HGA0225]SHF61510.1 undecaprenyl-diphosphatase [Hoylesella oralis]